MNRKRGLLLIAGLLATALILGSCSLIGIEKAKYTVLEKQGAFEIRKYAPQIVAETIVESDFDEAGNIAFRRLFGYISGNNRSKESISMTAPVEQQKPADKIAMTAPDGQRPAGEKIAMTAPVGQRQKDGAWAVSFMMPADYTLDTLPEPKNPAVKIREVPARRMAAIEYSGFWSEKNYLEHKERLEKWISEKGLKATGSAEWARYDPPFKPWFLRRNEVLIPVERKD